MKAALYDVNALVEMGKQYNSETKIAHEVAILQESYTRFQSVKKLAKAVSSEMLDSLKPYEETLTLALTKAQKDNNTVYLERVPPFADLPAIQGAPLAKSVAPGALFDASTEQLFTGLIPESSTKALSKYTDMVDSLTRGLVDQLAGATDAARLALRQAELPDLLEALDGSSRAAIPDPVLHDMEELQSIGGAEHLNSLLSEIGDLRRHVEADLASCQSALEEEATADGEARRTYGDKWKVPQSATLAKHLWEKLQSYKTTMQQAADSDGKVIQKLRDNTPAFAALNPESAASHMPRLQAPLVPLGEDPALVVARLRRNMEALNALSNERAGLEEAISDQKQKENILPQLMSGAPVDALFDREIKKYDGLKADVARNVTRNDELLAALTRDAQAFRTVFEVASWRAACDASAAGMKSSLKLYREVLDHLSEGLRFYSSLQDAVKVHKQQCSDFAYTRALQRDDLKQDLDRQQREEREAKTTAHMQNLHVSSAQQPGPVYPPHPMHTPHVAAAPPGPQPPAFMTYGAPPPGGHAPPQQQYQPPQQQYPPAGYGAAAPQVQQPYHGSYAMPGVQQQPAYGDYQQQQQQQQTQQGYGGYPQPSAPNPYAYQQQQPYGGYGQQQQQPGQQQPPYPYGR